MEDSQTLTLTPAPAYGCTSPGAVSAQAGAVCSPGLANICCTLKNQASRLHTAAHRGCVLSHMCTLHPHVQRPPCIFEIVLWRLRNAVAALHCIGFQPRRPISHRQVQADEAHFKQLPSTAEGATAKGNLGDGASGYTYIRRWRVSLRYAPVVHLLLLRAHVLISAEPLHRRRRMIVKYRIRNSSSSTSNTGQRQLRSGFVLTLWFSGVSML